MENVGGPRLNPLERMTTDRTHFAFIVDVIAPKKRAK